MFAAELTHAWLSLWDKHMTTGRINQVKMFVFIFIPYKFWSNCNDQKMVQPKYTFPLITWRTPLWIIISYESTIREGTQTLFSTFWLNVDKSANAIYLCCKFALLVIKRNSLTEFHRHKKTINLVDVFFLILAFLQEFCRNLHDSTDFARILQAYKMQMRLLEMKNHPIRW